MEGQINPTPITQPTITPKLDFHQTKAKVDLTLIQASSVVPDNDAAVTNLGHRSTIVKLTAQEIVDRLNALLKDILPEGLQSLKPEDTTPEATAERIVRGTTAFFDIYAKQHPELEGEELVESFMAAIRSGIDRGYSEAYDILEGLGAFEFEGVRDGVEQTKILIEQKLVAFEETMRKKFVTQETTAENTTEETLTLAGKRLSLAA